MAAEKEGRRERELGLHLIIMSEDWCLIKEWCLGRVQWGTPSNIEYKTSLPVQPAFLFLFFFYSVLTNIQRMPMVIASENDAVEALKIALVCTSLKLML